MKHCQMKTNEGSTIMKIPINGGTVEIMGLIRIPSNNSTRIFIRIKVEYIMKPIPLGVGGEEEGRISPNR